MSAIKRVAVIGTGMIGASLAALFTGNSYRVAMLAINDDEAAAGLARYRTTFKDLIGKGLVTEAQAEACEKLLDVVQGYENISDADFIFECVVERLEVKHAVYREIERHCKNYLALCSSTSALPVEALAEGVERKEKIAVAHPWNPPHLVPCVEVVKSPHTSDETVEVICEFLKSCGRAPVVMKKSAPGFVANRLQQALYREAAYMVAEGIASPEDIDTSLKTSFAPRYTSIGLFEHYDYAGLDMIMSIQDTVLPTLCNDSGPQEIVRRAYEKGDLGYKTGKGILDWSGVDIDEFRRRGSEPYFKFFNWKLPE